MNVCILCVYKSISLKKIIIKHNEVFKHVHKGVVRNYCVLLLLFMFRVESYPNILINHIFPLDKQMLQATLQTMAVIIFAANKTSYRVVVLQFSVWLFSFRCLFFCIITTSFNHTRICQQFNKSTLGCRKTYYQPSAGRPLE